VAQALCYFLIYFLFVVFQRDKVFFDLFFGLAQAYPYRYVFPLQNLTET